MDDELLTELRASGLLPHQAEFVKAALLSEPGSRIWLGDEVGLGKTYACVSLLRETVRRKGKKRFLILAPRVLTEQWSRRLRDTGIVDPLVLDPQEYRRRELAPPAEGTLWDELGVVVTSLDFLKKPDRALQASTSSWDLVLIEEAHLCGSDTLRGNLFQLLWNSPRVDLAVAISAIINAKQDQSSPLADARTKIFRRSVFDLRDWEGRPLINRLSEPVVKTITITPTPIETSFFTTASELARKSLEAHPEPIFRFFWSTFMQRAASSLFAAEQSLLRLEARKMEVMQLERQPEVPEEVNELASVDFGSSVQSNMPGLDLSDITTLLNIIESTSQDSKWEATSELLSSLLSGGPDNQKIVIFSEFRDTVQYLSDLCLSKGWSTRSLNGNMSYESREAAVRETDAQGTILILTSAAATALNLGDASACIHYDLPWNPAIVAQRMGRIHRLGTQASIVNHFLLIDEKLNPAWLKLNLLAASLRAEGVLERLISPADTKDADG